ncbi:hypothetical protein NDU88_005006 [Pleurodeles waltl]|uniref:Uncharacterized protein n=1 Tax=Pleurodeles waltl TaxID=8319 RepID=A0AAV7MFM4_PLEWA|nr:hypothetical protein NDU88_005006 [Pleurodeles waltl]
MSKSLRTLLKDIQNELGSDALAGETRAAQDPVNTPPILQQNFYVTVSTVGIVTSVDVTADTELSGTPDKCLVGAIENFHGFEAEAEAGANRGLEKMGCGNMCSSKNSENLEKSVATVGAKKVNLGSLKGLTDILGKGQ